MHIYLNEHTDTQAHTCTLMDTCVMLTCTFTTPTDFLHFALLLDQESWVLFI